MKLEAQKSVDCSNFWKLTFFYIFWGYAYEGSKGFFGVQHEKIHNLDLLSQQNHLIKIYTKYTVFRFKKFGIKSIKTLSLQIVNA